MRDYKNVRRQASSCKSLAKTPKDSNVYIFIKAETSFPSTCGEAISKASVEASIKASIKASNNASNKDLARLSVPCRCLRCYAKPIRTNEKCLYSATLMNDS
jgi:hypothetical protein